MKQSRLFLGLALLVGCVFASSTLHAGAAVASGPIPVVTYQFGYTQGGGFDSSGYWLTKNGNRGPYALVIDVPGGMPAGTRFVMPHTPRPRMRVVARRGAVTIEGVANKREVRDSLTSVMPMTRSSFVRVMGTSEYLYQLNARVLSEPGQPYVASAFNGTGLNGIGWEASLGAWRVGTAAGTIESGGWTMECSGWPNRVMVGTLSYNKSARVIRLANPEGGSVSGKVLRDSRTLGDALFATFIPATWRTFKLFVDGDFVKDVDVGQCVND